MGCGQVCCAWPNERTGPFEVHPLVLVRLYLASIIFRLASSGN
jgi:hypothetical protein